MSTQVAFVDTETTGLDPDLHQIWEVAAIVDGQEYVWQLPVDLGRADAFALKVGHFWERREDDEMLESLDIFAAGFAELTRGRHMVGAVPSFDDERLRKLLRANGACPEWHYHLIDVEALAVGFLAGHLTATTMPVVTTLPWKSDDLSRACGVEPPGDEDRHTALGDARWAKRLYESICGVPEVADRRSVVRRLGRVGVPQMTELTGPCSACHMDNCRECVDPSCVCAAGAHRVLGDKIQSRIALRPWPPHESRTGNKRVIGRLSPPRSPNEASAVLSSCEAARQKYLRLGREIENLPSSLERSNLAHTHSKLGIFLTEVLGENWTEWIVGSDLNHGGRPMNDVARTEAIETMCRAQYEQGGYGESWDACVGRERESFVHGAGRMFDALLAAGFTVARLREAFPAKTITGQGRPVHIPAYYAIVSAASVPDRRTQ